MPTNNKYTGLFMIGVVTFGAIGFFVSIYVGMYFTSLTISQRVSLIFLIFIVFSFF